MAFFFAIGPWTLWENKAIQLANQSTRQLCYQRVQAMPFNTITYNAMQYNTKNY